MKLKLIRDTFTDKTTIGKMFVDEVYECNTLEDVVRKGAKVYGKTAIPEGIYPVILDFSNKYQKVMPHVLDVPNFAGIRIHAGNDQDDTEGCILVGRGRKIDWISQSKIAFDTLFQKLEDAYDRKEKITIEVINERVEA